MKKRADWVKLEGSNLDHVEKHQWPPKSYFEEVAAYEKAVAKEKGIEAGGAASAEACLVM